MTELSLPELLKGIKGQIQSQEDLQTYLQQANAPVYVSEASDFDQIANEIVHHYLGALKEILEKANQLSEHTTQKLGEWAKTIKKETPLLESGTLA
jgi:ABC-type hemin transport system substrate-binding protein